MDHAACNVVYLDRRASEERVRRESLSSWLAAKRNPEKSAPGYFNYAEPSARDVYANVDAILSVFNEGESEPRNQPSPFPLPQSCNSLSRR